MKRYPAVRRRKAHHPRVPPFVPVPLRARADGWTAERQARFLAELAITRSVSAAARAVRMARETAYRLRSRPGAESFAAAWDQILGREGPARKVSTEERARRALEGFLKAQIYRGRYVGVHRKADNSALLGHLAALERSLVDEAQVWGRSQSFTSAPASTAAPLPRRAPAPICSATGAPPAPPTRGSR